VIEKLRSGSAFVLSPIALRTAWGLVAQGEELPVIEKTITLMIQGKLQ